MPDMGHVLKRYRDKFHLTQAELVARAGLDRSPSYISSLETGKASPTLEELDALALAFRTTTIDLISEAKGIDPDWNFRPQSDVKALLEVYQALEPQTRRMALAFLRFLLSEQQQEHAAGTADLTARSRT